MATVYWITGLSGAGKTTVGEIFFERLKKEKNVQCVIHDCVKICKNKELM